jgi:hypothetical protein
MAGVGKTALAIYAAHRAAHSFPDGQLYINLRGFDPDERVVAPIEALRSFVEALGIPATEQSSGVEDRAAQYLSVLAGRRVLVVLDNARNAEQVRPLLPGTPGCAVVVTSRNRLPGLIANDGAALMRILPLPPVQSVELLARRIDRSRIEEDAKATARVVEGCAGLPLALSIVGARAATENLSLAMLADDLHENVDRLDVFEADEERVNLRAVFSWSYRALSPLAARLLRLLAVHPGEQIGVATMTSVSGEPLRQVRAGLAELATASLVEPSGAGVYVVHDLVRAYADELLTADERAVAFRRLANHYVYSVRAAYERFGRPHLQQIPQPDEGIAPETPADVDRATAWYARHRIVLHAVVRAAADAGMHEAVASIVLGWQPMSGAIERCDDILPFSQLGLRSAQALGIPVLEAEAERDVGTKAALAGSLP